MPPTTGQRWAELCRAEGWEQSKWLNSTATCPTNSLASGLKIEGEKKLAAVFTGVEEGGGGGSCYF